MIETHSRVSTTVIAPKFVGRSWLIITLAVVLFGALLLGVGIGAVAIPPEVALAIILSKVGINLDVTFTPQQMAVLWHIRLPRVVLGGLAGAALAVSGALLQGIFRNPLADPGLIGISSGAALGAVFTIVSGVAVIGIYTLPIAAFLAGTATTLLVYQLSRRHGRTDVAMLLLVGLALNALAGATTGLLTYLADDAQLRSIVFWTLGGLGGALWETVLAAAPLILFVLALAPRLGFYLNLFALGETEARHLGVNIEWIKRAAVLMAALATGATVALVGPIGFIGLIVPHMVRLAIGPDHRWLIPACALGGAMLLVLADLLARTLAAPAEIPVGLFTAFAGGPFFLVLILRTRRQYGLS
ncbi:iron ABC transporter permease [uncultured Chloroflexus sp.]|uniref:FecCD family ABC transporter permease n=1 Tax=uncultured Chloroflexus sp. TaxID=214040 RepID=UPI002614CA84|nr:iron ABC transporter permease [uncultured Chloroflexus sp.]